MVGDMHGIMSSEREANSDENSGPFTSEFSLRGRWWLPGQPEIDVEGILKCSTGDGAVLDLSGAFGGIADGTGDGSPTTQKLILGITQSGLRISLLDCVRRRWADGSGYATSSFYAHVVFVGAHFEKAADMTFASMSVRYSHLDSWASMKYFEHEEEEGTTKLAYKEPEPVAANVGDHVRVWVGAARHERWSGAPTRAVTIKYQAAIGIELGAEVPLDEYLRVMRSVQVFLSLGMGEAVHPLEITATKYQKLEDRVAPLPVDIWYQLPRVLRGRRHLAAQDMTFTLSDMADSFEQLLGNWFEKWELLEPTYHLYYGTLESHVMFEEQRFLSLTQAVESFHRRRHGGKYLSSEEYEPAYDQLVSAIPHWIRAEHRQALETRLRYGHEFSLRKRLTEIFRVQEEVLGDLFDDSEDFIDKVVKTRNYLTHYDVDDKHDAATSGADLRGLAERLRVVLETCLLAEVGFNTEQLRRQSEGLCSRRSSRPIVYD